MAFKIAIDLVYFYIHIYIYIHAFNNIVQNDLQRHDKQSSYDTIKNMKLVNMKLAGDESVVVW